MPVGFAAASARLANLVAGGALLAASTDSYDNAAAGLMRVGPAPGISRLVRAEFRDLVIRDDAALLTLRWEAAGGATGSLFPALDADIRVIPGTDEETLLRLDGVYRAPLGALGAGLDNLVLHRVAAATIRAFIGRVADLMAHPAPHASHEYEHEREREHEQREHETEPGQSWSTEPGTA